MITVGELKQALTSVDDAMPLGLCVYNHSWYGNCHRTSHGEAYVAQGAFSDGSPIMIIYTGSDGWPRDVYCLRKA